MTKDEKELLKAAVGYSYKKVRRAILLEDGTVTAGDMVVCRYLLTNEHGLVIAEDGQVGHYDAPKGEFKTEELKQAIEFGLGVEGRRAEIVKVAVRATWGNFRETRVIAEVMSEALRLGTLELAEECAKRLCVEQVHLAKYLAMRKG